jgi:hypothetical protein
MQSETCIYLPINTTTSHTPEFFYTITLLRPFLTDIRGGNPSTSYTPLFKAKPPPGTHPIISCMCSLQASLDLVTPFTASDSLLPITLFANGAPKKFRR